MDFLVSATGVLITHSIVTALLWQEYQNGAQGFLYSLVVQALFFSAPIPGFTHELGVLHVSGLTYALLVMNQWAFGGQCMPDTNLTFLTGLVPLLVHGIDMAANHEMYYHLVYPTWHHVASYAVTAAGMAYWSDPWFHLCFNTRVGSFFLTLGIVEMLRRAGSR